MVDGCWLVVFRTQSPSANAIRGRFPMWLRRIRSVANPTPQSQNAQLSSNEEGLLVAGRTNNQQLTTNNY